MPKNGYKRREVIAELAELLEITKKKATKLHDTVITVMKQAMLDGKEIEIPYCGTLFTRKRFIGNYTFYKGGNEYRMYAAFIPHLSLLRVLNGKPTGYLYEYRKHRYGKPINP